MCADFRFYLNRQGVRGVQGVKGDDGFSPIITVAQDDADGYKLHIQTATDDFDTSNLRPPITDAGGKYLLWDNTTGTMTAGFLDYASTEVVGGVNLATAEDMTEGENTQVVPPVRVVADYVAGKLEENSGTISNTITQTIYQNINAKEGSAISVTKILRDDTSITGIEVGVKVDNDTIKINEQGQLYADIQIEEVPIATTSAAGIVKPDGSTITVDADGTIHGVSSVYELPPATNTTLGGVIVGYGLSVSDSGYVEMNVDTSTGLTVETGKLKLNPATESIIGGVKPDGTTITITSDGTITAVGGGSGGGDVTAAGNNTFTGINEFDGLVTFSSALNVSKIKDLDGVDVFAPLGSSNAFGSKVKNTVLRGNTLSYSTGGVLQDILHRGNVDINPSADVGLYWSDSKLHCGGYISDSYSTPLEALKYNGGLYRELNQDGVKSVALAFDRLDGLQTHIQYTSTTPTEFTDNADDLVNINNAYASDDERLFVTGDINPIPNDSSKTITYKFNNHGSDGQAYYGKVVTGIDSFVNPLPEGVTISYAAGNSPSDMTSIPFDQLEQNKIQGLYFSITITNNSGSSLWATDFIGNDSDGDTKPIELITSSVTDNGHIVLQPKVDGETIQIVDGALKANVDISEINSQISAMQADITAIEQQIGNIVTRLNEINGEDI